MMQRAPTSLEAIEAILESRKLNQAEALTLIGVVVRSAVAQPRMIECSEVDKAIAQYVIDIEEGRIPRPDTAPPPADCPKELKRRVRAAFAGCEYCGRPADPWQFLTVDRIVPGSAGGRYTPTNVTGACWRCNSNKGAGAFIGPVRSLAIMEAAQ